jgi:hypothetical protein
MFLLFWIYKTYLRVKYLYILIFHLTIFVKYMFERILNLRIKNETFKRKKGQTVFNISIIFFYIVYHGLNRHEWWNLSSILVFFFVWNWQLQLLSLIYDDGKNVLFSWQNMIFLGFFSFLIYEWKRRTVNRYIGMSSIKLMLSIWNTYLCVLVMGWLFIELLFSWVICKNKKRSYVSIYYFRLRNHFFFLSIGMIDSWNADTNCVLLFNRSCSDYLW